MWRKKELFFCFFVVAMLPPLVLSPPEAASCIVRISLHQTILYQE